MSKENQNRDENCDDSAEPQARTASRLGKEAKIGVSVIVVLLVILGVAISMRLSKSGEDKALAVNDDGLGKSHHDGTAAMLKDTPSKFFNNLPAVLPAQPGNSKAPKLTDNGMDKWKSPSDRKESKPAGSASLSIGATPPFPPEAPKTASAGHDRYSLSPPPSKESKETKDPFAAKPLSKPDNIAKPMVTDMALPAPPVKTHSRHADTSGFAMADAPPAPLPSRDAAVMDTALPPASRSNSMYSAPVYSNSMDAPAMPAAQIDSGEFRNESAATMNNRPESHRAITVSSYTPAPRREDGKYEVQPNDSYWTVSERLYGSGSYFKALAEHNRGKAGSEDQLKPGELILAPTLAQLEQLYPAMCPKPSRREAVQSQSRSRNSMVSSRGSYGRSYTVVEGDTLFNIARYELGKASRWAEIYEINRDVLGKDINYLAPGTRLSLPDGEKSETIARPASRGYTR